MRSNYGRTNKGIGGGDGSFKYDQQRGQSGQIVQFRPLSQCLEKRGAAEIDGQ
jgi:hypothetical protein